LQVQPTAGKKLSTSHVAERKFSEQPLLEGVENTELRISQTGKAAVKGGSSDKKISKE
jgi:hypothetical protein